MLRLLALAVTPLLLTFAWASARGRAPINQHLPDDQVWVREMSGLERLAFTCAYVAVAIGSAVFALLPPGDRTDVQLHVMAASGLLVSSLFLLVALRLPTHVARPGTATLHVEGDPQAVTEWVLEKVIPARATWAVAIGKLVAGIAVSGAVLMGFMPASAEHLPRRADQWINTVDVVAGAGVVLVLFGVATLVVLSGLFTWDWETASGGLAVIGVLAVLLGCGWLVGTTQEFIEVLQPILPGR